MVLDGFGAPQILRSQIDVGPKIQQQFLTMLLGLYIYVYNYILLNLREVATLHIIQSLREKEPFLLGKLGFVGLDLLGAFRSFRLVRSSRRSSPACLQRIWQRLGFTQLSKIVRNVGFFRHPSEV